MRIAGMLLAMLILSFYASAQAPGGGGAGANRARGTSMTGRFYGKVVDASNKGVEAASVTLVQDRMDSATQTRKETIVGGMLTSARGDFSLENVPAMGRYKLRVTGIGYKQIEQNVSFDMPNRNAGGDPSAMMGALDKDLGNIKVEIDDKVLGNVTVSSTARPLFQMGIDRKIFNVEQNTISAGGNALDVMKNIPSITVDIDGNVSMRNSAPQIFVDGRPTTLTLEQIPADAIESVELITNPSAKFDASGGTAGILNIVLKKNKRVGYSGNVRASIDSRLRPGFGVNGNVRQNKINAFASVNINGRKSIGTGQTTRRDFTDTSYALTFQDDRSEMQGTFGFGRAGFDYFIDNRNTLTISGSMGRGGMNPFNTGDILSDYYRNNSFLYQIRQNRTSVAENEFRNMGAQASFKHIFPKTGHEWSADITYNKGKNNNLNLVTTRSFQNNLENMSRQEQLGSGNNNNYIFQTDYAYPIRDNMKIEAGARATIRQVNSVTTYYRIDANNQKFTDPTRNIIYNSNDQVYAAYGTFSNRIKNFGYQLGLRAESSDYEGVLPDKNQQFNISFPISLFPSVFLTQKTGENDELQFNYSRRINRPNFWQLFPFYDIADTLNIGRGEPNLRPEFTNSLELSYNKMFKNRDNILATIYFKNTNDLITRIQPREYVPALDTTLPVLTYTNANASYVTGFEVTSRNKVTKFWDVTTNVNLFTSKIDLVEQEDPEQFLSYFVRLNNNVKLSKALTFQLSANYDSKRQVVSAGGGGGFGGGGRGGGGGGWGGGPNTSAQGYIRPQYFVDAALRFDFLKDRAANLSLSVNDVFRTRKFDSHTESDGFIQDSWRIRDPQIVRLNFNWRFGKFDASLFRRKNNREEGAENINF